MQKLKWSKTNQLQKHDNKRFITVVLKMTVVRTKSWESFSKLVILGMKQNGQRCCTMRKSENSCKHIVSLKLLECNSEWVAKLISFDVTSLPRWCNTYLYCALYGAELPVLCGGGARSLPIVELPIVEDCAVELNVLCCLTRLSCLDELLAAACLPSISDILLGASANEKLLATWPRCRFLTWNIFFMSMLYVAYERMKDWKAAKW